MALNESNTFDMLNLLRAPYSITFIVLPILEEKYFLGEIRKCVN